MQSIHEYGGFKVDKNELSKLFFIIYNNPGLKNKELEIESGYGKTKIENLKYYLRNWNLLEKDYKPTQLADVVYENDKYFEDEFTLWVLFYHWTKKLSNPFLYYLLNNSFEPKNISELTDDFFSWAFNNEIKTDYGKNFVRGLISRTVNSFTDPDAFKILNIYTYDNNFYYRDIPYKTNPLLIAYVAFDNRNNRTTITFEELLKEPNNIGKVFNMTRETLQQYIYSMRDLNLVQYVQNANLQHVTFLYKEHPIKLLSQYYEQF